MTVHLVGAGPGDPELLTLKAARLIAEADVIVHDYLSNDSILEMAKPGTEFIDVGKKPGNPTPQELQQMLWNANHRMTATEQLWLVQPRRMQRVRQRCVAE